LINLGVNPNPVDVDRLILYAAKDAKIKKSPTDYDEHNSLAYKRFNK
jgi:hypothetical protein